MFKPSVTIHKSESGKLKVLACSEDAGICLEAYRKCNKPGQLAYIRKGALDKQKKVVDKQEKVVESEQSSEKLKE